MVKVGQLGASPDLLNTKASTEILKVLAADETWAWGVTLTEQLLQSQAVSHDVTSHFSLRTSHLSLSAQLTMLTVVLRSNVDVCVSVSHQSDTLVLALFSLSCNPTPPPVLPHHYVPATTTQSQSSLLTASPYDTLGPGQAVLTKQSNNNIFRRECISIDPLLSVTQSVKPRKSSCFLITINI